MTKARDLASATPVPSTVSATELGYVDGVTSAIQTQINAKATYPTQTGNSGKFLTTDGTNPSWGTVAGGYTPTLTLLNSGGTPLSGSTTTISGISGKQWLYFYVVGASTSTASNAAIAFQLNADTTSNYLQAGLIDIAGAVSGYGNTDTFFPIGLTAATSGTVSGYGHVWNANATTPKPFMVFGNGGGSGYRSYYDIGHYQGTSAISSISVTTTAGTFDAGTIYVYGA